VPFFPWPEKQSAVRGEILESEWDADSIKLIVLDKCNISLSVVIVLSIDHCHYLVRVS